MELFFLADPSGGGEWVVESNGREMTFDNHEDAQDYIDTLDS
jgi:hypothetical protein